MSFVEINVNNSFNKEGNQVLNKEPISIGSTLGNNSSSHQIEVNSINATSLTNSIADSQLNVAGNSKRNTLIREIFIATSGTIIGSITTYFILGIK